MLQTAGMVQANYHIKPPTEKTIIRDYHNKVKIVIEPIPTKNCMMYEVAETKIEISKETQKWLKE